MSMHVRAASVTIHVPSAQTLKDKRQILRSLLDRTRRQFNVAIAEVDAMDCCQKIVVGLACVSNSDHHAAMMLDEVIRFIENNFAADIVSIEMF